jgi:hypothetical protein
MLNITKSEFYSTLAVEMGKNSISNYNQELLIMGAVQLFWEHNKNIAYLQDALRFAQNRNGVRVNAVKAFLTHFTGATYSNKVGVKNFIKGGKLKEMGDKLHNEFVGLDSWLSWANDKAPEPEYNLAKQQLKVIAFLQNQKTTAIEHNQHAMADMLEHSIEAYAEVNKKVAIAS